jgi:hypothetical protein
MIGTLAVRSLVARPVRSAVLAAGFGFGVGVMAILLGVAEVVLEQAQAPALVGGGDVLIRTGPQVPAPAVGHASIRGTPLARQNGRAVPHLTALLDSWGSFDAGVGTRRDSEPRAAAGR